MGAIGGKNGPWAYANVGVIFALIVGFFGHMLLSRRAIHKQENRSQPLNNTKSAGTLSP